jgi:hypothetical protein
MGHNRRMAMPTTMSIERSGAAIRAVLVEHAPQLCAEFEAEFHTTMAEADDDFDTSRVDALLGRWWARAFVLLNPDPEADAAWERIKAGDTTDLVEEWRTQPDGSQHVYRRNASGEWTFSYVRSTAEA